MGRNLLLLPVCRMSVLFSIKRGHLCVKGSFGQGSIFSTRFCINSWEMFTWSYLCGAGFTAMTGCLPTAQEQWWYTLCNCKPKETAPSPHLECSFRYLWKWWGEGTKSVLFNIVNLKDSINNENYREISLMSIDAKILNKTLTSWIQKLIQKMTHHNQVAL